jgi:hypothetical protein
VTEENLFSVTQQTNVRRGNDTVPFGDIRQGEIVSFDYSVNTGDSGVTNVLHNVRLQERSRNIRGSLVGRHLIDESAILVIEGRDGYIHEYSVAADTYIFRNGEVIEWLYLRIGDNVSVQIEFDRLISVNATGNRSTGQGILEEINITPNLDSIVVRQANDETVRIALPPDVHDIYALHLGMELRYYLNSLEIYELVVVNPAVAPIPDTGGIVGYVQSLRHGHTIVVSRPEGSPPPSRLTIRVDGNTINTATGETINFRDIRSQARLYIVLPDNGNTAKSITILP